MPSTVGHSDSRGLSSRNLLALTGVGAIAVTAALVGVSAPGSEPGLPSAAAAPSTTTTTTAGGYRTDEGGWVGTDAHCGSGQPAIAIGRTARSLVVVCHNDAGPSEYRGVRISDGAALKAAATDLGDGSYRAVNDGVDYTVTPEELRVTSGDSVIYRDTWIEFEAPRFAAEQGGSSATPSTSSSAPTTTGAAAPQSAG